MNALILTVGDEILIGQTLDTNSAWIGRELNQIGVRVIQRIVCGDELPAIMAALEEGFRVADIILMTGGLGPTKDDITKTAIAGFFNVEQAFHTETYERILRIFERLGRPATEAHRQQCFMPVNAQLLANRMGTAPGMLFREKGKILISMPGVPYEMQAIMTDEVLPLLTAEPGLVPIFHETLLTAGLGESTIAQQLEAFEQALPDYIKLAYLPSLGQVRLRLSAFGGDRTLRSREIQEQADKIRAILGNAVFGRGEDTLESCVGRILRERGLTLATAESCTGGDIAHHITSVAGSSQYYLGTIVAYHNFLKTSQLGVPADLLQQHGAVSEPVVLKMLDGVLDRFDGDVGMSASGVAGPDGGTPAKPVGTIWIAVGNRTDPSAIKLQLGKDRVKNIEMTAVFALNHLRLWLIDHPEVLGRGLPH
ncbi:MAG: CinA family nicotinamide mononucleotide deamidase-related protein [Saprospiraceae bacterium]|jgi:nicotinamide-nucleotide amidase|nr:CinA family nicotinamide mononucleotide deamidase-related protein [Saprospiraceae bacterium]